MCLCITGHEKKALYNVMTIITIITTITYCDYSLVPQRERTYVVYKT